MSTYSLTHQKPHRPDPPRRAALQGDARDRAAGPTVGRTLRRARAAALLAAALSCLDPTPALAAIALSGSVTTNISSAGRSSATFMHTVPAGSDRLLVVMVHIEDDNIPVDSVTYAGFGLTQAVVADGSSNTHTELWYLINPPVGADDVVVTYASADSEADGIAALNYTGVNQISPIGATAGNTATSGTDATVDITTTTANSLIVGGFTGHGGDTQPASPGTDTTERYDTQTGDNSDDIGLVGGEEPSARPGCSRSTGRWRRTTTGRSWRLRSGRCPGPRRSAVSSAMPTSSSCSIVPAA